MIDSIVSVRAAVLVLLCGLLAACSAKSPEPSQPVVSPAFPQDGIESAIRPALFQAPDFVRSHADRIELAGTIPVDRELLGAQAWVIVAPPGDFDVEFNELALAHRDTGETRQFENAGEIERLKNDRRFERTISVRELGVFRRVRLLAIRVDPESFLSVGREMYRLRSFDVTIRFPEWTPAGQIADSAYNEGSIRTLLEKSVANPEALDLYAQPSPSSLGREVPGWQPRPENSIGFTWLRIPVSEDGIMTIDARWLSEAGVEPGTVDPADLRLMSRGEEVGMLRFGPQGASFSTGARLAFYGLHSRSSETRERVYYLGRRSTESPSAQLVRAALNDEAPERDTYRRRYRFEEDNSLQTRLGSFLSIREMTWVWDQLEPDRVMSVEFVTDGLPQPVPEAHGRIELYTAATGATGPLTLKIVLNGVVIDEGASLARADDSIEFAIPAGLLRHESNTLELTLQIPPRWRDRPVPPIYLDAIEIVSESLFKAERGRHEIDFSEDPKARGSMRIAAVGFRPSRVVALDITDPAAPVQLAVEPFAQTAVVHANPTTGTRILVVEEDVIDRAPSGLASQWHDWNAADRSADAVVIYHENFAATARSMGGQIRSTGRETILVDVETLYEAYSYGEVSTEAIRDFLANAIHRWTGRRPEIALLIGDCTSDGQRVSRNEVVNYVPTRETKSKRDAFGDEYASDQYYAMLAGEDELSDLIVGRLSVASTADAQAVAGKCRVYRGLGPAPWTGRLLTVTDPGEFLDATNSIREATVADWIDDFSINTAAYPWEDNFYIPREYLQGDEVKVSPAVTNLIEQKFEEGQAFVMFFGHGSPNIWSNQRVWFGGDSENSDNLRLDNGQRLPFLTSFTCNNGAIDYPVRPWNIAISEDMMRVRSGGIIGGFLPSGPGFPRNHSRLAEGFYRSFGRLDVREFGQLTEMARLFYQAVEGIDDHSRMYFLLGDPTLEIPALDREIEVRTEPEVLEASLVEQRIEFKVSGVGTLTSGTVFVEDSDGHTMAEALLVPVGGGGLAGSAGVMLPPGERAVSAIVQATDSAGRLHQSGLRIPRAPAPVTIREMAAGDLTWEPPAREVTYFVENLGGFPAEAKLNVYRLAENEDILAGTRKLTLAAGEIAPVTFRIEAPPGAWVLRAEIDPAAPGTVHSAKPSSRSWDAVTVSRGEGEPDLAIPPRAFRLLPARGMSSQPLAQTFVANLGGETALTALKWKIQYPGGKVIEGDRVAGRVEASSVLRTEVPMRVELEMTTDFTVELVSENRDTLEGDLTNNRLVTTVQGAQLPDIRLVKESLRVTPGHLAEGVTVFVEGWIENIGGLPTQDCRVGLYDSGDEARKEELRTLAGQLANEIPSLQPGERWPFRVRWDPFNNLDTEAIRVVADSYGQLVESNKANNEVLIPLDIKSKWNLEARGMARARSEKSNTINLIARIENTGETDARRVAVWFYSDEEQSEENFLGETIVDRIPANSLAEVTYEWNFAGADLQKKRSPSFSVALKGSLMRISSLADE